MHKVVQDFTQPRWHLSIPVLWIVLLSLKNMEGLPNKVFGPRGMLDLHPTVLVD